jgi:hypothetical protein
VAAAAVVKSPAEIAFALEGRLSRAAEAELVDRLGFYSAHKLAGRVVDGHRQETTLVVHGWKGPGCLVVVSVDVLPLHGGDQPARPVGGFVARQRLLWSRTCSNLGGAVRCSWRIVTGRWGGA